MKISKTRLTQIIKEELGSVLEEATAPPMWVIVNKDGKFKTPSNSQFSQQPQWSLNAPKLFMSAEDAMKWVKRPYSREDELSNKHYLKEMYVGARIVEYKPGKSIELKPEFLDRDTWNQKADVQRAQRQAEQSAQQKAAQIEKLRKQLSDLEK